MVNFTSDYVVSSSVETRKVNRKIKVLCIYTLDNYFSTEQPLETAEEIPFGISIIATVLEKKGADVDLLVLTEASFKKTLDGYFSHNSPELICLNSYHKCITSTSKPG